MFGQIWQFRCVIGIELEVKWVSLKGTSAGRGGPSPSPAILNTSPRAASTMVLQSNFAKRYISGMENTPPSSKTAIQVAARRRRARTNGAPRASRYTVEQAKRRSQTKPAASLRFKVAPAPVLRDVQMKELEPVASSSSGPEVTLPKHLGRPQYCEVAREALSSVDPELGDADVSFIREELEKVGPEYVPSFISTPDGVLTTTFV